MEGDAECSFILSNVYFDGKIVDIDIKKGQKYLEYAVSQRYPKAEYNLGYYYFIGENGYPVNYVRAVQMYRRAAIQNNAWAISNMGFHYTYGLGDVIKANHKIAVRCAFKSARLGDEYANRNLGLAYYHGEGIAQNYRKAIEWFTRAIKLGKTNAYYDLGKCYYYGHGVEKDLDRAFLLMSRAAISGDNDGKRVLKFYKQPYTNKDIKLKYPDIMTMDFHLENFPDEYDDDIEDIDFSKEEFEISQNSETNEDENSNQDNTIKEKVENMLGKFFNNKKMQELELPKEISQNEDAKEIVRIVILNSSDCQFVTRGPVFEDCRSWGILLADLIRTLANAYEDETGVDSQTTVNKIKEMLNCELDSPTE